MSINFEHHEMRTFCKIKLKLIKIQKILIFFKYEMSKFCKIKLKLIKILKILINFEHHEINKFSNQNLN